VLIHEIERYHFHASVVGIPTPHKALETVFFHVVLQVAEFVDALTLAALLGAEGAQISDVRGYTLDSLFKSTAQPTGNRLHQLILLCSTHAPFLYPVSRMEEQLPDGAYLSVGRADNMFICLYTLYNCFYV